MILKVKIAIICGLVVSTIVISTVVYLVTRKKHNTVEGRTIRARKNGCTIHPFEVELHPLVVISGTNNFIYPEPGEKLLHFDSGKSLDFICPDATVILAKSDSNKPVLNGTCVGEDSFKILNVHIQWKNLRCSKIPGRTIRYTGNSCGKSGREIEAGFAVEKSRFLRFILICFNQELLVAYYTNSNLTASINQRISHTTRPGFSPGSGFYDVGSVNNIYLRKNQKATINKLLGLPEDSNKYIQDTGNYYLARGHLTPRSDGFYAAQKNVTFFYQNVAPQWQTLNNHNWRKIENDTRDYAENRAVNLQIWTGVHGVTTLPHEDTKEPVVLNYVYTYVCYIIINFINVYSSIQLSAFFYQNVAPQWQTLNNHNWRKIENDTRDYAENRAVNLQIWTGVHGVTTLPHEDTKEPVGLYLFVDQKSNRKALPVPEFFWKVAYNPLTKRGIAMIGINNPYNDTFATICKDVSKQLTWFRCKRDNQQNGFCYACRINLFRKVVPSMPKIPDKGLLL